MEWDSGEVEKGENGMIQWFDILSKYMSRKR
jgi:hypothetical protein